MIFYVLINCNQQLFYNLFKSFAINANSGSAIFLGKTLEISLRSSIVMSRIFKKTIGEIITVPNIPKIKLISKILKGITNTNGMIDIKSTCFQKFLDLSCWQLL